VPDNLNKRLADAKERLERLRLFWNDRLAEGSELNGVTLELGCGHGHWLTAYAERNRSKLCVGVDLITKRVDRANRKKNKRELTKLHFLKAEAVECLSAMPPELKIHETVILFPDPWPKKRHHKRRLINEPFLNLLAERSQASGKLFFRTDHEGYFDWTTEKLQKHELWKLCSEDKVWPLEHETYFQNILPEHQSITAQVIDI